MNKLKEELRLKLLGQLSDDKTELDIDNAYEVCVKFTVSFSLFCAENSFYVGGDLWTLNDRVGFLTTKELLTLYLENERNTPL